MPKTRLNAGEVKETVIQERIVDEKEAVPGSGQDAFEYMDALTPAEWDEHIVYIYRMETGKQDSYIDKFAHTFDESYLKENFGGGTYSYILKKGSQRIKQGRVRVEGPARDSAAAPTNGASDLVRIVEMLKKDMNSGSTEGAIAIQTLAFKNALEIQKASIPPAMNIKDLTEAMGNLQKLNGGGAQSEMPEWLKQIVAAAIPAGVALLTKMLTPQDALAGVETAMKLVQRVQGINGEPGQVDLGTKLLDSGPQWLEAGAKVLAELRATEERRTQNLLLARGAVAPAVHSAPARSAAEAYAAANATSPRAEIQSPAVDQTAINEGKPTPEFVWNRVITMCKDGESGGFACDWLEQLDPEFIVMIGQATLDQLDAAIRTGQVHPLLVKLAEQPRYPEFLKEFHAQLKISAAKIGTAAVAVN